MANIGLTELLVILAIVVLVFGAKRLPEVGESIGKAIKGLKRGLNTDDDIQVTPKSKQVTDASSAEPLEPTAAEREAANKK